MRYDVHAHLDLYRDRDAVIGRMEQQKIYVVSMTNLPELYDKYCHEYPSLSFVRFALGFHPELAKDYAERLPYFMSLLPKARFIGEIGLDFSKQKSDDDKRLQRKIFEQIVEGCKKCVDPKILSIHSRNAANEIIDTVGKYHGQIILHWLSDKNLRMSEAIDYGYYFSINKQMASYQNGQNLIRKMPVNRLLIESDAPFTKENNQSYMEAQLNDTVEQLAEIFGVSSEKMQDITSNNFRRLLNNEK
jgi:TatD DNase family protein